MEQYKILANSSQVRNRVLERVSEFRKQKLLLDVTLACADGVIQCHRLIICSLSPILNRILQDNGHSHPYLYLKGIQIKTLASLLEFMYEGKVKIPKQDILPFLEAAEELKVYGLAESGNLRQVTSKTSSQEHMYEIFEGHDDDSLEVLEKDFWFSPDNQSSGNSSRYSMNMNSGEQYFAIPENPYSLLSCNSIVAIGNDHTYPDFASYQEASVQFTDECAYIEDLNPEVQRDKRSLNNSNYKPPTDVKESPVVRKTDDGFFLCSICGFMNRSLWHVKKHIVESHEDLVFSNVREICDLCNRSFKNKSSLSSHKYIAHKESKCTMVSKENERDLLDLTHGQSVHMTSSVDKDFIDNMCVN